MKQKFLALTAVSFILSLTSCSDSDAPFINDKKSMSFTEVESEVNRQEYNGAMNILENVADNASENTVFSPLNVMSSLMMLANGANGDTQKEILDLIAKSYDSDAKTIEEFNELHKKLSNEISHLDKTTQLSLNNALWVNESKKDDMHSSFQTALSQNFKADIFSVGDFASKNTMDNINNWFSNSTNGLISNFLKEPLSANTKMFIASSMFFKGNWETPFETGKTKTENFTNIDGSQSNVEIMNAEQKVNAAIYDGGKLILLPFGNGAFKMALMLPDEGHSFKECVDMLRTRDFKRVCHATNRYSVKIKLPKISIESETDIRKMLSDLGVNSLFNPETADFSNAYKSERFYLSGIKHVVKFEMDETGAQAASATGIPMDSADFFQSAYDGMEFYANKPFLFMIFEADHYIPVITGVIKKL